MKLFQNKQGQVIQATLNRRSLMKGAAATLGAGMLPAGLSKAAEANEPHFFLNVVISGGLDASMMFDARPLKMTDQGKIQNYYYKNDSSGAEVLKDPAPIALTGSNGTSTLVQPVMEPLMKYQSDFSIVNGVCMLLNGFEGHGNNMYYLFTNGGSGGQESFVPKIGQQSRAPLESVHIGGFEGDGNGTPANFSGSIQLRPGQGGNLANTLKSGAQMDLDSSLMKHIRGRLSYNAQGNGLFSLGAKKMLTGIERVPALSESLKNVQTSGGTNEFRQQLDVALAYIKGGVSSAYTIMYDRDPTLDTHSASAAQTQLTLFREVVENIDFMFETLKNTPYDEDKGLSFLDVTTVMVTTEFSRTMIQSGREPGNTGTDHNPLTNTAIIAGKGIKGGQVIGASDLSDTDADGNFVDKSAAHDIKDSQAKKIMGKPFDFATEKPRTDLPTEFKETDYLTFASVANTLMSLSGVPEQDHFRVKGNQAPILKTLLK